jgi:hypothetical protein
VVDELLLVLLDVPDVVEDELSSAYTADTIKSISRQLKIPSFHFMFFPSYPVFRHYASGGVFPVFGTTSLENPYYEDFSFPLHPRQKGYIGSIPGGEL